MIALPMCLTLAFLLGQAQVHIVAITFKTLIPPSGDKHDYYSFASYWWPACPDGVKVSDPKHECPYVTKDGKVNPDVSELDDHRQLQNMAKDTLTLALAWQLLDIDRYAERASKILRDWFINPDTRMNPNGRYAQTVRGKGEWLGRGPGLIDLRFLLQAANAASILQQSQAWTEQDHNALVQWFSDLSAWYTTSEQGKHVIRMKNNVKTWYDAQLAGFYAFTGKTTMAKDVIQTYIDVDYSRQIDKDGGQSLELQRTHQFHFSNFNLEALIYLAKVGDEVGIDVWHTPNQHGANIKTAVEFLLSKKLKTNAREELQRHVAVGQAKYGKDTFLNQALMVASLGHTQGAGITELANDATAPPINGTNAWPTAKRPTNPAAEETLLQQIKTSKQLEKHKHKLSNLFPLSTADTISPIWTLLCFSIGIVAFM
ncbi:hypothetical protein INT43_006512 [Umbelopsis isabellina]|uniref:Alginate lyase domain-containing protein n=1 Tax=Mortierella isabellina TaxID=91625 RepID=A0A8H7Q0F1_MORIS|nr:hypothetical protein INT43_006512 [Umbelopsis isabellina]